MEEIVVFFIAVDPMFLRAFFHVLFFMYDDNKARSCYGRYENEGCTLTKKEERNVKALVGTCIVTSTGTRMKYKVPL